MNTLDSPLEALAFNYLSFGFLTVINNIWTWVAVITAAVSFWRIKAAGAGSGIPRSDTCSRNFPDGTSSPAIHDDAADQAASNQTATTSEGANNYPVSQEHNNLGTHDSCVPDLLNNLSKFTVYYKDECEEEFASSGEADDDGAGAGGGEEWCEGWESILVRLRMGDGMGWYRYQDSTVLDGSVVRLWDGCKDKTTPIPFLGSVTW